MIIFAKRKSFSTNLNITHSLRIPRKQIVFGRLYKFIFWFSCCKVTKSEKRKEFSTCNFPYCSSNANRCRYLYLTCNLLSQMRFALLEMKHRTLARKMCQDESANPKGKSVNARKKILVQVIVASFNYSSFACRFRVVVSRLMKNNVELPLLDL